MTDDGRQVHLRHPKGYMIHAITNATRPPRTTEDLDAVTCRRCLHFIQENEMNPQQITEVSATVDTGLSQDDLDGMTEAERLALVVGAAYGKALADRDEARADADELAKRLETAAELLALARIPLKESTWAHDADLADSIQAFLDSGPVDSEQTPAPQEDQ